MKKIFWIGLIMLLIAFVWSITIQIQIWDMLLTKKQEFFLTWKPIAFCFIGIVLMQIGIYKK